MSRNFWLVLAACISSIDGARGADLVESLPNDSSAERIAGLIDELAHPTFAKRQAAMEALEEAGVSALEQLEAVAAAGSRESASRALAILKKQFQSGSQDTKPAARAALARLAQSSDPSSAQRARDILNPPQPVVATTNRFGQRNSRARPLPPMPPPVNNLFGNAGLNGGFRRVSVADMNGRKVVELDDRERRVKMETLPGGEIEVEVADKQNAGNPVRRIAAKDFGDLRGKDPEIGRLYEQYRQMSPGVRLNGVFGAMPAGRALPDNGQISRLQLESIRAMLDRYRERLPTDPGAQRMIDSLERTRARLEAMPLGEAAPRLAR